jgi:hypothetical protein
VLVEMPQRRSGRRGMRRRPRVWAEEEEAKRGIGVETRRFWSVSQSGRRAGEGGGRGGGCGLVELGETKKCNRNKSE